MEKDGKTWVVFLLNEFGEALAEKGELEKKVSRVITDKEIFTPYARIVFKEKTTKLSVIEGYFFVESGLPENEYFKLARQPYIESVLHTSSRRGFNLQTIPNTEVAKLKHSLQEMITSDIELGMKVLVNTGTYKGLKGEVVGFTGDRVKAFVYIELRTLKAIRAIPTYILDVREEDADV